MQITREQYEADIRKAKAQALREAAEDLEPDDRSSSGRLDEFREGLDYAQEALTDRANELDPR